MFTRFDFVAAKVFLGLDEQHVFAQLRRILPQRKLLGGIHRVFTGVINALTGLFTDEPDQFALLILFCHNLASLTDRSLLVNSSYGVTSPSK